MTSYLPPYLSQKIMNGLEACGDAELLYRDAAKEEFGREFKGVRSNQIVAKVTVTKYYKHTQFGYEEIPESDIGGN